MNMLHRSSLSLSFLVLISLVPTSLCHGDEAADGTKKGF
jgi:hypothetical protein